MNIQKALSNLDDDEKLRYATANEYFRNVYYSKKFSSIVDKLDKEKITDEEWKYLLEKLYVVTFKAIEEEYALDGIDKILYAISRIGSMIFKKGKIHDECAKMIAFGESLNLEEDINCDLLDGLEKVEMSMDIKNLHVLLKQHREAVIFRDSQDAFLDLYEKGIIGIMTYDELLYISSMDRAYIREKELVKEYE